MSVASYTGTYMSKQTSTSVFNSGLATCQQQYHHLVITSTQTLKTQVIESLWLIPSIQHTHLDVAIVSE